MLTIKMEENPRETLEKLGIACGPNAVVMSMKDADTLMGAGVMKIGDGYAEILNIRIKEEFTDFSLEYGIGKALLNAVDLKGIQNAVCNNMGMEKLLSALGFSKVSDCENVPFNLKENKYYLNLTGYFDANC